MQPNKAMMKMIVLLLVSTLGLLVSARPQVQSHHDARISDLNRRRIFDLARNYSKSLPKEVLEESFVENTSGLTKEPHKCQAKFFCKVEDILEKHPGFGSGEEIVQTLAVHNRDHKAICDQVKAKKTGHGNFIQLKDFLVHVQSCIQHRNMYP